MAKILVVDDALTARQNMCSILQANGHQVIGEASDGMEAVTKYEELQPDLVTMDLTMPVLDGIGAVKQITAKHPDARIIIISAVSLKEHVIEALKNGAKYYILKPFKAQKVIEVIDACLQSR